MKDSKDQVVHIEVLRLGLMASVLIVSTISLGLLCSVHFKSIPKLEGSLISLNSKCVAQPVVCEFRGFFLILLFPCAFTETADTQQC